MYLFRPSFLPKVNADVLPAAWCPKAGHVDQHPRITAGDPSIGLQGAVVVLDGHPQLRGTAGAPVGGFQKTFASRVDLPSAAETPRAHCNYQWAVAQDSSLPHGTAATLAGGH